MSTQSVRKLSEAALLLPHTKHIKWTQVSEPLGSRIAHLAPIEGALQALQPDPLPSSEDIAILHGLPHPRRMGRADSDDFDVALPFPPKSLTYVKGVALVIGLQNEFRHFLGAICRKQPCDVTPHRYSRVILLIMDWSVIIC